MTYQRIGEMLLARGLITEAELARALKEKEHSTKRVGEILIAQGAVEEDAFLVVLGDQLGVQVVDLAAYPPAPGAMQLIDQTLAKKYGVVPLGTQDDTLYVAMTDPLNFFAVEDIKRQTGLKVVTMLSSHRNIDQTLAKLYGNADADQALQEISQRAGEGPVQMESNVVAGVNRITDDPSAAPTVRLVNSILERAITERASDVHFEPRESGMVVRLRIDGALHTLFHIPMQAMNSVISRLKIMGNMDIAERKIRQDGRANIQLRERSVDLRISTLPTVYGEKMVIRLLDKAAANLGRQGIGLTGTSLERYEALLRNSSGVLLISGPTGSGKSSTMYTMIQDLNTEDVNMVTLEDPVEFNTEGINQCQINEKTGMTFANGLRAILRQDPDIIVVGEIRDGETASIAMRAAITGHLVLSTIHTNDTIATVDRLLDMEVEPFLISTALKGVIAQRLVRRICPRCKEHYSPTKEECELVGIPYRPDLLFYRGRGCRECFNSGYRGRAAVFEILLVDNAIRKLVSVKADREEYLRTLTGSTFLSLSDYSRNMILDGVTTAQEAVRTIYSTVSEA